MESIWSTGSERLLGHEQLAAGSAVRVLVCDARPGSAHRLAALIAARDTDLELRTAATSAEAEMALGVLAPQVVVLAGPTPPTGWLPPSASPPPVVVIEPDPSALSVDGLLAAVRSLAARSHRPSPA